MGEGVQRVGGIDNHWFYFRRHQFQNRSHVGWCRVDSNVVAGRDAHDSGFPVRLEYPVDPEPRQS